MPHIPRHSSLSQVWNHLAKLLRLTKLHMIRQTLPTHKHHKQLALHSFAQRLMTLILKTPSAGQPLGIHIRDLRYRLLESSELSVVVRGIVVRLEER